MKIQNYFCILLLLPCSVYCQSVIIDPSPANANLIKVQSSNKSVLVPRMTSTQRTALLSLQKGMLVFDTTTNTFWFYNGSTWIQFLSTNNTSQWQLNGNHQTSTNTGKVGVGLNPTKAKLEVNGVEKNQAIFNNQLTFSMDNPAIGFNNFRTSTGNLNNFDFSNNPTVSQWSIENSLNTTTGDLSWVLYYGVPFVDLMPYQSNRLLTIKENGNVYVNYPESSLGSNFGSTLNIANFSTFGENGTGIRVKRVSGVTENDVQTSISPGGSIPGDRVLLCSVYIDAAGYSKFVPPGNNNAAGLTGCNYFVKFFNGVVFLDFTTNDSDNVKGRPYVLTLIYKN